MVTLEKVREQDLSEVHHIQKLTFESLSIKYQDEGSPFNESKESLIEKFQQSNTFFFFIRKNEEKIGYVRISTNDNQTKAKIGPIGIIPQSEEQGCGTEAMLLVEKEFSTVKEWYLSTILQETKLTHFYSKMGYKETGEMASIQEDMDLVFFVKKLE